MQAKDIMTKEVITVTSSAIIKDVIKLCIENKISGVIVVENDEVLGVVTEKDLLVAHDFLQDISQPIKDFISKNIIGIDEDTSVEEISRMLVQRNIKRVPVVKNNKLLGIVSRRDVLRCIIEK